MSEITEKIDEVTTRVQETLDTTETVLDTADNAVEHADNAVDVAAGLTDSLLDKVDGVVDVGGVRETLHEAKDAAKDVLDRIGVSKTDKVEVKAPQGIFLLPRKNDEQDGTEEGTNDI